MEGSRDEEMEVRGCAWVKKKKRCCEVGINGALKAEENMNTMSLLGSRGGEGD